MNKLSELMGSLNQFEVKQFRNYLLSPYFNVSKGLAKAFEVSLAESEKKRGLDKTVVYKKSTGAKTFDDKAWRYLQTELSQHLEYFLTLRFIDSEKKKFNSLSLQALSAKECDKSWNYIYNNIRNDNTVQHADHYLTQYVAAQNKLNYNAGKQSRKLKFDYQPILFNLDAFYLSKKLQLFCEITNLKNILGGEYDLHLYNELKTLAADPAFQKVPVVQVYYHVLLTLTEPAIENHFEKLQSLILKYESILPVNELNELFHYVKNYCIRKANEGNTTYFKKLFNIYQSILDNRRLMYHDYLSQFEFKNIVSISLRLNEKQWCKKFIAKYISFLKPAERKNALAYNMAYWYFNAGDFKNATRKLQEVEFTDVVYQLDARVILLKCYYEQDDQDSFFYHASAFRLFLLRNRHLSEYQKKINRNLIKFLSTLLRAGTSNTKLKRLKDEIMKEKNVADLAWLLEKVETEII